MTSCGAWTLDWGDGQTESGTVDSVIDGQWTKTLSHDYCDDFGDRLVTATVTDTNDGTGTDQQWLPLYDVTTTLSMSVTGRQYAVEGEPLNLNDLASFSDPGFAAYGQVYYTIDWGDGSGADTGEHPGAASPGPTTGTISASHTYLAAGIFTVNVAAYDNNDNNLNQATGSFKVYVSSPPSVSLDDVILDPPHYGAGSSCYDLFSFNLPVVWPGELIVGRITQACYRKMGVEDLIVHSAEEYVRKAVQVATDRDYQQYVTSRVANNSDVLFNDLEAVREHERFFDAVLAMAGNAP